MTDRELVKWALQHGWRYFHANDQLMDPKGGMTTANRWDDIGDHRREQILAQMKATGSSAALHEGDGE